MIIFKIAIRNILRHKTRSMITLSTIVFGCVAVIFVGGFFENMFDNLKESYIKAHTGHIQIFRQGFFEKGSAEPFNYLIHRPKEIISLINSIKGIRFVTPRLEFSGLLSTGENTVSFIGQGVDPKNEITLLLSEVSDAKRGVISQMAGGLVVESGVPLEQEDTYSVLLGKGLAAGIGAKLGDGLIIVGNTISGSINALDVTLKGVFFSAAKAFDDHFLRLPIKAAQKLLHTESIQSLVIMLDKTEDTERVKKELEKIFKQNNLDLELKSWDELSDFYTKTVQLFNRFFLILKIVIAIIVILSIFNTMNMAVLERVNEIGTIMALGTKKRGVLKLFLCEGIALGIIGGVIGVISGVIVTKIISSIGIVMPPAPGITFSWLSRPMIVPSAIMLAFILSFITAVISSLYPAYKASRLEIADALRHV